MLHDLERGALHVPGYPKTSAGESLVDSRRLGRDKPLPYESRVTNG